jgi:3-hydroxyisobutyrate dehydrogenase-like beta-hydroxyacid dehydrogenase
MASQALGFIGVGRMGGPMAGRLMDAGYPLVVFDTKTEATKCLEGRGAKRASSPAQVASAAEIVFCSLPTPAIVREVALGADGVVMGDTIRILIDLSTTGPGMAKTIAADLAERNIAWTDAPVSGGIAGASAGTLAVMSSCPRHVYAEIEPLLKVFGRPFYCGETPGVAQVAKLGNNMIAAGVILLSAEAVAMGAKAGLDPKVMCDIINASSGRNSATQDKFPKAVLTRTFDFGFATALSYKDVKLCVDEAEALGVPMVTGSLVRQMLAVTNAKYGPDSDFTSMVKIIEEWAGVEIKSQS